MRSPHSRRTLGCDAESVDFAGAVCATTVDWYLANRDWWQRIRDGRYRSERLGMARVRGSQA